MLHGWPGSVREFYDIIKILTKPQQGKNYVFEMICPSLPGFGFSDGAAKPGMGPFQIGIVLNGLMKRLKLDRYYVQGGDWGAIIAHALTLAFPKNVLGLHRNFCYLNQVLHWKVVVGAFYPSLFFTKKEIKRNYPLSSKFDQYMLELGYFHIQATKPDTVGIALRESPIGLAGYILEKFIVAVNPANKNTPDGKLTSKFTYEQLLDNIMFYWVTRSITTAVRIYSEWYNKEYQSLKLETIPFFTPSACARFEHEFDYPLESIIRESHINLIHLPDFEGAGHFAAFEVPKVLAKDIFDFVQKVRKLPPGKIKEEL